MFRAYRGGRLDPLRRVTSSARFEAQADVAVDPQGRPWIAWNESGVNWGKDQGFLITPPMATPLHQERSVRVATWDGSRFQELRCRAAEVLPLPPVLERREATPRVRRARRAHPRLPPLDPADVARHRLVPDLGELAHSIHRRRVVVAGAAAVVERLDREGGGDDGRRRRRPVAGLDDRRPHAVGQPSRATPRSSPPTSVARRRRRSIRRDGAGAAGSKHPRKRCPSICARPRTWRACASYRVNAGGKSYGIYRGDLHRHTDVSQDFKYDGSLIEVYRYAIDAAAFDFIAPTDHQAGWDQEFSWWQSQKLADLFHLPGAFVPIFGYERSLPYPNGHRNVFFLQRGVRTLPVPKEEQAGQVGAAKLYEYLRANGGISMPHSSATDQGTDWRDNDPELEPLMEIFQGYRGSYEYKGAPRAASDEKLLAQRSGYQPLGFWWNALERGYKLGVQASSDHWSTHISYACLIAPSGSRAGPVRGDEEAPRLRRHRQHRARLPGHRGRCHLHHG